WMTEHKDQPFFMAVGFFRPHTPFVAPKKYFDLYPLESIQLPYAPADDREDIPVPGFAHNCPLPHYNLPHEQLVKATQAYYACVSFIDAQVGRLLASLKELDIDQNTIVVFWSDHGYHLGEHAGIWQKRTLFEESAQAPLIIRSPHATGNGAACERIVEFIDIYPTIAASAGLPIPPHCSGRDLTPLLTDPTQQWNGEGITQILRPADSRLETQVMGRSIRTHRWRYTDWAEGEAGVELYDHHADPNEFRNLAKEKDSYLQSVQAELRAKLEKKASGRIPTVPVNPKRL
ncbi:MAG: sulfatase-like hydrolase/transferase, partial [Verrucomicrobiota bacterium]